MAIAVLFPNLAHFDEPVQCVNANRLKFSSGGYDYSAQEARQSVKGSVLGISVMDRPNLMPNLVGASIHRGVSLWRVMKIILGASQWLSPLILEG